MATARALAQCPWHQRLAAGCKGWPGAESARGVRRPPPRPNAQQRWPIQAG